MIDVVMTAWPNGPERLAYFEGTLRSFLRHVRPSGVLSFFCTAERTDVSVENQRALESLCERFAVALSWHNGPPNLGAAMNRALSMGDAEYVFMLQDDFALTEVLDLQRGVEFLQAHQDFCAIRYQYNPRATWFSFPTIDGYSVVDMIKTRWAFLDSPSLRRRSMVVTYGRYTEGLKHKAAEHRYGRTLRHAGARVAASNRPLFDHIGDVSAVVERLDESTVPSGGPLVTGNLKA